MLAAGGDEDDFAPEEVVGIAGTVVEATFSYPMVCWLVQRHSKSISIQWDDYERETQRAVIWPRFFPLMEEDSLTEANVPYLDWLKAARGRQDELPWLVRQFQRLPGFPKETAEKEKAALYDSLEIMVRWDMSGANGASRTLSRKPVKEFYFHREPLIQRRQVSLAEEFAKPRLPINVLSSREAEKALDLVKEATGVRYRELYGTANADPAWVAQANPGRGVEIYFWGLPPEKRLPLRAYLAGFTVKNGVPINYVECISLFDWTRLASTLFLRIAMARPPGFTRRHCGSCGNCMVPTRYRCTPIRLATAMKKLSAPEHSGFIARWDSGRWTLRWKSWPRRKKRRCGPMPNIEPRRRRFAG